MQQLKNIGINISISARNSKHKNKYKEKAQTNTIIKQNTMHLSLSWSI